MVVAEVEAQPKDVIAVAAALVVVRVGPVKIGSVGPRRLGRVAASEEARAAHRLSSVSTVTGSCRRSPSSSVVSAVRRP